MSAVPLIAVAVEAEGVWQLSLLSLNAKGDVMAGKTVLLGTLTRTRKRARISRLQSIHLIVDYTDRTALKQLWRQVRHWRMVTIPEHEGIVQLLIITNRLISVSEYRNVGAELTSRLVAVEGITITVADPQLAVKVPPNGWTLTDGIPFDVDEQMDFQRETDLDGDAPYVIIPGRGVFDPTILETAKNVLKKREKAEANEKALDAFVMTGSSRGGKHKWRAW